MSDFLDHQLPLSKVACATRLRAFIAEHARPCRVAERGAFCDCPRCDLDALVVTIVVDRDDHAKERAASNDVLNEHKDRIEQLTADAALLDWADSVVGITATDGCVALRLDDPTNAGRAVIDAADADVEPPIRAVLTAIRDAEPPETCVHGERLGHACEYCLASEDR